MINLIYVFNTEIQFYLKTKGEDRIYTNLIIKFSIFNIIENLFNVRERDFQ